VIKMFKIASIEMKSLLLVTMNPSKIVTRINRKDMVSREI
jgi:hypothetical protein